MMKFLKILSVILLTGILFSACQKDYDIIDGAATGTLKEDASGDCMPVTINGIYTVNTNVGAGNFVDIQVNIDNIGTYDISTDTVNGYFFHAAASVAITGLNTIRLQASGKPIITGTDIFRVKFSGTVCELNVSVGAGGGGPGGPAAVFTLRAATTGAACTGAAQSGAYNQGLATGSSNTVTVFADVTTAGTYTATTTLVNGVSFSGSGTLAIGTNQPIVLTANGGIPAAAGTFNYPLTAGTSTCSFNVIYGAALPQATITPNCATVTVNGTYQAGTAMTSMNTILVPVTVTTPGTYLITTATQNGVSFSGSGVVTAGSTSIILTASATTPTAAGTFTYPLTINGSSSCSVSVTYTAAPPPATDFFQATLSGVFTTFNNNAEATFFNAPVQDDLLVGGDGVSPTDFGFDIDKSSSGGTVTTGTYDNTLAGQIGGGYILSVSYTDPSNAFWAPASVFSGTPDPFTIQITTISGGRVKGTFSGTIRDNAGTGTNTKTVTGGTFDVPLN